MANDLFGFTGTQSMVKTNPIQVNVNADLRASKAMDSILNLANTGLQAANKYQEAENKASLISAKDNAMKVHQWYDDTIKNTHDEYARQDILNQYKTALTSIEDAYSDMKDEYKIAFKSSNYAYTSAQDKIISEQVYKRKISDTDTGLTQIGVSLAGAPASELTAVMKDAKSAYLNIGMSEADASEKVFSIFMGAKINAIDSDNIMGVNLKQLKEDKETLIKEFDPMLKGKELDTKLTKHFDILTKEQGRAIKEYLNDFVSNDNTSVKAFKTEMDKYSDNLSDIDKANFIQDKTDRLEAKRVREQAKQAALNYKAERYWEKQAHAFMADPTKTPEEINTFLQQGLDKGYISQIEKDSFLNIEIKASEVENTRKVKEQTKQDIAIIDNNVKSGTWGVDSPLPTIYANMVSIAKGDVLSSEDITKIKNYNIQYNLLNNTSAFVTKAMDTSLMNIPLDEQQGYKEGMGHYARKLANYQNFNAEGIIKIYNNYGVDGDVKQKLSIDVNNPNTVVNAVSTFNKLKASDDATARHMLGTKLYGQLTELSANATVGKDGSLTVSPDIVRKVSEDWANPEVLNKIDTKQFYKDAKDSAFLLNNVEEYKALMKIHNDHGKALDILTTEYKSKFPAPGISLAYYPGKITQNDIDTIKRIPEYLNTVSNGEITGIHYDNGKFYYSSKTDKKFAVIEEKQPDGTFKALSDIKDVYAVINNKATEKIQQSTAYKIDKAIKSIPSELLKLNPTHSKEDVPLAQQALDFLMSPYKDINKK